jgi:hypothetical protein
VQKREATPARKSSYPEHQRLMKKFVVGGYRAMSSRASLIAMCCTLTTLALSLFVLRVKKGTNLWDESGFAEGSRSVQINIFKRARLLGLFRRAGREGMDEVRPKYGVVT